MGSPHAPPISDAATLTAIAPESVRRNVTVEAVAAAVSAVAVCAAAVVAASTAPATVTAATAGELPVATAAMDDIASCRRHPDP